MKRIFLSLVWIFIFCGYASADPSFSLHNTTSFYLYSSDQGHEHPNCPGIIGKDGPIGPNQSIVAHDYWCGFVACATKDAKWVAQDSEGGVGHISCQEPSDYHNQDKITEGGYATYFGLSLGARVCTVRSPNAYVCSYASNGDLNLTFANQLKQTYSHDFTDQYHISHKAGEEVKILENHLTPTVYTTGPQYRGINISGLEYDGTFLDAMFQRPDVPDVKYFAEQGMNTIRLPIRAEFALSTTKKNAIESTDPNGVPNDMYLDAVHATVQRYLEAGLTVILDMHNYMRFCPTGAMYGQRNEPTNDPYDYVEGHYACQIFTPSELSHVWRVVANKFADLNAAYPGKLIYGVMNEPYANYQFSSQIIKTEDVLALEAAAVKAIYDQVHDKDPHAMMILSGNYWDPMHGWDHFVPDEGKAIGDLPNGQVFTRANIMKALINAGFTSDQANAVLNNIAVEMHQYADSDFSGRHEQCLPLDQFIQQTDLSGVATWIKQNQMKVWITEFGAADNLGCQQDLTYLLDFMGANAYNESTPENGGIIGWTAWRANRHGNTGFSNFNYLQAFNWNVWGALGYDNHDGTGIVQGPGNGLMGQVFAKYLHQPTSHAIVTEQSST